jgi:ribosomal protein L11
MRSLSLKTERLAELTTDELLAVAGARADQALTSPLRDCARTVFGCTTAMTCPVQEG